MNKFLDTKKKISFSKPDFYTIPIAWTVSDPASVGDSDENANIFGLIEKERNLKGQKTLFVYVIF